jgi:uncharacterized protein YqgC (DUF456 family)
MSLLLDILLLCVVKIGGSKSDIGLVIGAFTIPIMLLSPFIDWAADELAGDTATMRGTRHKPAVATF